MSRYLVTIDLTEHLADHVKTLQNKFNRFEKRWLPPHVTMIPPTEGELSVDQLRELGKMQFSFDLHTVGWASFTHDDQTKVMYLMPQADGLLELWHQIARVCSDGIHGSPTMPTFHVTVAKNIPLSLWPELEQKMVKEDPRGHCRVRKITVYAWDEQVGDWKIA